MKSRKVVSIVFAALLLVGVCGISFADNAAQLDVKISYLYPMTKAVAVVDGFQDPDNPMEVVNIYITLLDAAGNPATAGPKGEALNTVVATISSKLANSATGEIVGGEFLALANTVKFDAPSGVGAVARGNVDYTDARLTKAIDTDQIIVSVANEPNPAIVGDATVVVEAPPADSLVVRTFRDLPVPNQLFEDLSISGTYGQKNNNGATQQAGSSVSFWVIANHRDNYYTFAPELEGTQVTVRAYADYSADNIFGSAGDVPGFESEPIGEATATFANGIATGTIAIKNAGPTPGLAVVLTAVASEDEVDEISSAQMNPAGIEGVIGNATDSDVDFVTMLSNKATRIALWSDDPAGDPYGNGNLIQPDDCLPVVSTGQTQIYGVALVDPDGNAWKNNTGTTLVFESSLSGLNNAGDPDGADVTQPGGAIVGATPIDVPNDAYAALSVGLAAAPGAPNVGGTGVVNVEGVEANVALAGAGTQAKVALNAAIAGVPDATITNDKTGQDVVAGTTIKLTLLDGDAAVDSVAIQPGDNIIIMAIDQVTGAPLAKIGLAGGTFESASSAISTSVTDNDSRTDGYQISVVIYTATVNNVNFMIEDIARCFSQPGTGNITQILPADPFDIRITGVAPGVEVEGTLSADPILIVNEVYADGTPFDILEGNGVLNELVLVDQYGNVADPSPTFTCVSTSGLSNPAADPDDANSDLIVLSIPEYAPIVAQENKVDTIKCEDAEKVGTQSFEIRNIELSPASLAATKFEIKNEGPQDQAGTQIDPANGGEAIIRISADGTSDNDRPIKITAVDGELRGIPNGGPLPNPYETVLPFDTTPEELRLIASPDAGKCVTVTVEDKTISGPLAAATAEIGEDCTPCTVAISPSSASVAPGGTVDFAATTTGGDATPAYTWAISATECTGTNKGSITQDGTYTAPAVGGCCETIKATDTANGCDEATAEVCICEEIAVTITPPDADLKKDDSEQFTASTTCDGDPVTGCYSWKLDGQDAGTGSSYTFTCNEANKGDKTLTVTDTCNGNETKTAAITCTICEIKVVQDQVARSRWIPLPALLTIECEGDECDFKPFATRVDFEGDSPLSVIKAGRLVFVNQNQILQLVLIGPALLTGGLDQETETVTVTVTDGGCDTGSDTFGINLLPFFLDKQQ